MPSSLRLKWRRLPREKKLKIGEMVAGALNPLGTDIRPDQVVRFYDRQIRLLPNVERDLRTIAANNGIDLQGALDPDLAWRVPAFTAIGCLVIGVLSIPSGGIVLPGFYWLVIAALAMVTALGIVAA